MEPDLENLQYGKDTKYRRLFEKAHEGEWDEARPLPPKDMEWYESVKYENNPDLWEDVEKDGYWTRQIKDEHMRSWYDWYDEQHKKYVGDMNWKQTRLPQREYYERVAEMERDGIGEIELTPQTTGNLVSLRVKFPEGFRHLTNEIGQRKKEAEESGYHISLMYHSGRWADNPHRGLMDTFIDKYFGGFWDRPIRYKPQKVRITRGSTYELSGDGEFEKDLAELVNAGTQKSPHISLD